MVAVKKEGVILKKTTNGFENEAVFNPAVIRAQGKIHLFYRAVRAGNYSSIGYCELDTPLTVKTRYDKPILMPKYRYESQGIEDPRIVQIGKKFFMTYSVYDNINVLGAYATSTDLKTFKKHKIITPKFTYREYKHLVECCKKLNRKYLFHYDIFKAHGLGPELSRKLYVWDKNVMFFPKKINGQYALIHRIHPGIQLVLFKSFNSLTREFWEDHLINLERKIILDPEYPYESGHIGGGCPPIETKKGWLLIYHSAEDTPQGFVYHASAALLDLYDPLKVIGRLSEPLFSPTEKWEKEGVVNNVVFPTGTIEENGTLYIYYGAADTRIAVASVNLSELMNELSNSKKSNNGK